MNGSPANLSVERLEREHIDATIEAVAELLDEVQATDRYTLGSVAAYLLRWALSDLPMADREVAMNDMAKFVLGRLDG